MRPLVEFLVITKLERARNTANRATSAVLLQIDFAVEGGGRESFAFNSAHGFLDGMNDDFRGELHDDEKPQG